MVFHSVALLLMLAQAAPPRAQTPPVPKDADAAALARGWNALASGQYDAAARAADAMLERREWDGAALQLKISALSALAPARGLDAYEARLARSRREDIALLEPVAIAVLQEIARTLDSPLKRLALEALVDSRVAGAREALVSLSQGTPFPADAPAARAGDRAALDRLTPAAGTSADATTSLAEALAGLGAPGESGLLRLMKAGNPDVRAAASQALASSSSVQARQALGDASNDADPRVRLWGTIGLARAGDPAALARVDQMLASSVPDLQIAAAMAWNGRAGPWVEVIRPLLDSPEGLTRIEAARVIAPVDPEAAKKALQNALNDPNPVIRSVSAKTLQSAGVERIDTGDIGILRPRLRDPDPAVRLSVASALLKIARS